MGQKLSCVSKKSEHDEDLSKPRKKKPFRIFSKRKERPPGSSNAVQQDDVLCPKSVTQEGSSPVEVTERKTPLVLLKPAPHSFHAPIPMKTEALDLDRVTSELDNSKFTNQVNINQAVTDYAPATVDQVARDIGSSDAKPASWTDLYYNLVTERKLNTDFDIVKALFSWLCSIPMKKDAFVTYDDLKQAVNDNIPHAKEALEKKSKSLLPDSPEVIVNELTQGKSTYLRAFSALCRYCNIPCYTIKGLAKGVDYSVGMNLSNHFPIQPDQVPQAITRLQHAWSAAFIDGRWALFDCIWGAERLAVSASARISQAAKMGEMDYETDMFYFDANPAKFIYSHYPFDNRWQLLNPPLTLEQFQNVALLKPSFFVHGLGLFSHQDGVIPVQNKLLLTLSIAPTLINTILFTFNLRMEGTADEQLDGHSLARLGIHEISQADLSVTFNFRFPKAGIYKLTLYSRKTGEYYFTDICEYRVEARGPTVEPDSQGDARARVAVPSFPPTSQSHYGPTEKATELSITTVPHALGAQLKSLNGIVELRFSTVNHGGKLPRLTARLKTVLKVPPHTLDCLLVRVVEPTSTDQSEMESTIPMIVITGYLPIAGEYALEVYGAPADSKDDTSYFLAWQFLVDAEVGIPLNKHLCKRLITSTLGPQDEQWESFGLRAISHPDPLIHVSRAYISGMKKTRSKTEMIQKFASQTERREHPEQFAENELAVQPTEEADRATPTEPEIGPQSCDLKIVIEMSGTEKLCVIGHLTNISGENEEDQTSYLLEQLEQTADSKTIYTYLIRIPKGDCFYKFFLYAAPMDVMQSASIPLVYTYLIDAPARLLSSEKPYIGVSHCPFPEKLEQQKEKLESAF